MILSLHCSSMKNNLWHDDFGGMIEEFSLIFPSLLYHKCILFTRHYIFLICRWKIIIYNQCSIANGDSVSYTSGKNYFKLKIILNFRFQSISVLIVEIFTISLYDVLRIHLFLESIRQMMQLANWPNGRVIYIW